MQQTPILGTLYKTDLRGRFHMTSCLTELFVLVRI